MQLRCEARAFEKPWVRNGRKTQLLVPEITALGSWLATPALWEHWQCRAQAVHWLLRAAIMLTDISQNDHMHRVSRIVQSTLMGICNTG